ncbi:MAG: hypothetical protein A2506_08795 [Elusimicrobia bacterium RIFOXYD12_FULL_66_9]|nr:MAG: hypothetical protein A2506_08795 [Elusimicrobia bacterium RIFOXYD12_FULL_66_9]
MRDALLRLILLLAAFAGAVRCLFWGATPLSLGVMVACGLASAVISWRKARSIDRDRMGLPPRL